MIHYSKYAIEASKVTLYCLAVTVLSKLVGASNQTALMVFNMAVMSCAATFAIDQKPHHIILGSSVIVFAILISGTLGFYFPDLAILLAIVYVGLAFYLAKPEVRSIHVNSAVMVVIFTALPFNWQDGIRYLIGGLIVMGSIGVLWLFEKKSRAKHKVAHADHALAATSVVLSLILATIVSYWLSHQYSMTNLYWIALTIIVVVQPTAKGTMTMSLKRILSNTIGAVIAVLLFSYVVPNAFWVNFALLSVILYCIFFFSFARSAQILFIELFVLGFVHLLGDYQNFIAFERFILTLIGGVIAISMTQVSRLILKLHR